MKTATTYIVHLVCTLSLALPHGWCCLAVAHAAPVGETPHQGENPQPACHHCFPAARAALLMPNSLTEPGQEVSSENHTHQPVPQAKCECSERQTTPQRPVAEPALDLVLPGLLPVPVAAEGLASAFARTTPHQLFAGPPLQLMNCVWLC